MGTRRALAGKRAKSMRTGATGIECRYLRCAKPKKRASIQERVRRTPYVDVVGRASGEGNRA